ncbi:MFS transporter [Candidatus Parcubacteria bacterium]|nr:MFS transporter [Candidatus Parcubacteria bacterium]
MNIHYLKSSHFSPGFMTLFTGRMIQHVGNGLIGLFLPIYLMIQYGGKIEYVFYFYLTSQIIYSFFLPFGVRFLNKFGLRRSLQISVFFFSAYYISLFFLKDDIILYSGLALFFLTIGRTLFWLPFGTDLAKFTDKSNRGKGISMMWASRTTLSVLMPLISGFLLAYYGYSVVFILAIATYLSSIFAYLKLPRTYERYSWGYFETWKHFFAKENRRLVYSNMANGAESVVGIIIWPIFIWQLLNENYVVVGGLSSLIVFVTVFIQLIVGKYTDTMNKRKMIHWGSALYAIGWVGKIFVLTSMQIFAVGVYHNIAKIFKDTPFDALNYELMADRGHFVDEYTGLKEIAVSFGKMFMLAFVIIIVSSFGLNWTFALAALASLFINFL